MSCRTGMWRGVVVTFAICSGLSVLLQPLVLQGCMEHREGMCRLDFSAVCAVVRPCVRVVMGEECGSRVPYMIQAQAMYSLYAEIAHHDCPLLCVASMCSDES